MEYASLQIMIPDEKTMLDLGARLASACAISKAGLIIYFYGQLGAGKTTLARGFIRGLGYTGQVKSPTYTIVEPYELEGVNVFHFDFYRLRDPMELEFIGIQDYFKQKAICLIEWPDLGITILPAADLSCYVEMHGQGRMIKLIAQTENGKTLIERFQHEK